MHVLILGGTRFAGRAVTDAALDRGDTVTLFNRFIDVRDLGGWIIDGARRGLRGVFNVTGEPIPFGRLLGQCVAETDSGGAVPQWVPSARLLAAGVDPWMGVPLWIGVPGGPEPGREGLSHAREEDLLR